MTSLASSASPPFTAAQWEELERQALVYKHFATGVPVPHELLLPFRRAAVLPPATATSAPFFYHPNLGYLSYYGKKLDPEPGRCRRTDGKKWRCSKDAHPDSKYCERHMHRSRNRSRKPVENKIVSQTQSSTSIVTSHAPTGTAGTGTATATGSISTIIDQYCSGGGHSQGLGSSALSNYQWNTSLGTCGLGSSDYRHLQGVKTEVDQHNFLSGASASWKAMGLDSSLGSSWRLLPSEVPSFSISHPRLSSSFQASYQQGFDSHNLEHPASSYLKQQQCSLQGSDYNTQPQVKHEREHVRPFLDEWPRTRDLWSDMEQGRSSSRSSFSTTQLSISVPTASDYSTTCSTPKDGAPLFLGIEH